MTLRDRFLLLLNLLFARIDGGDPEREIDPPDDEPDIEPDPDAGRDGDPDPEDDDVPDGDDDPETASSSRPPKNSREVEELRERTRRLEADIEQERAARRTQTPNSEQLQWEKEQRLLDAADTSPQDRHAIETNRALRQSHALSQAAHQRAEDLADKAEYNLKAMDNPTFRKYAQRVEEERNRIAAAGRGFPPRETVLAVLLGRDMLNGKLAPAKTKSKVARSAVSRPRSDVRANTGRSEQEKRRARLENQFI